MMENGCSHQRMAQGESVELAGSSAVYTMRHPKFIGATMGVRDFSDFSVLQFAHDNVNERFAGQCLSHGQFYRERKVEFDRLCKSIRSKGGFVFKAPRLKYPKRAK